MKLIETEIFVCDCHSFEHQVKFMYDDEERVVYLYVHLTRATFWSRLIKGIKYIFGYSSKFGEWDEFVFQEKDQEELRKFLNKINKEDNGDPLP